MSVMAKLRAVNPTRHLVARLFLWFWTTLIICVLCALWLGKVLSDNYEVKNAKKAEVRLLDTFAQRMQVTKERYPDKSVDSLLKIAHRRDGLRHFVRFVMYDPQSQTIIRGQAKGPAGPFLNEILEFIAQQDAPVSVTRGLSNFVGAKPLLINDTAWLLYIQRPSNRPLHLNEKLPWLIGLALIISAGLCYVFARSIVKPISRLQMSTRLIANGDLKTRVDDKGYRQDEIGHLVDDFNTMASRLETMWSGQQRLLADVSHELRSPLARLQMAVGLASQKDLDSSVIQRIEREAERMELLIDRLLRLTRVESSQAKFTVMSIHELLSEIMADASFETKQQNKQLVLEMPEDFEVQVNAELLLSGVENIVRNAIRYAIQVVKVCVLKNDNQWFLTIEDDGPGVPLEELEHIFKPFYRPSSARDRESGGAGLGLAIAKAVVDLHHGVIKASLSATGGLSIMISLPLSGKRK